MTVERQVAAPLGGEAATNPRPSVSARAPALTLGACVLSSFSLLIHVFLDQIPAEALLALLCASYYERNV
jgi:hypothetical protein